MDDAIPEEFNNCQCIHVHSLHCVIVMYSQSNSAGRCEFCIADHEFPMMSSFRLDHFELLLETSAMLRGNLTQVNNFITFVTDVHSHRNYPKSYQQKFKKLSFVSGLLVDALL